VRNDYRGDKEWSDRFLPQIKAIIAEHLIHTAPFQEDISHNTDLIVLKTTDNIRFACRVRRPYYMDCKHEFTIRYKRESGVQTEWNKVIQGWGDYLFYGISGEGETIDAWGIGNLNVFRRYVEEYKHKYDEEPGLTMRTKDGTRFKVFRWKGIEDGFIVASYNIETEIEDILQEVRKRHEGQKIETILPKKENTQARLPGF